MMDINIINTLKLILGTIKNGKMFWSAPHRKNWSLRLNYADTVSHDTIFLYTSTSKMNNKLSRSILKNARYAKVLKYTCYISLNF